MRIDTKGTKIEDVYIFIENMPVRFLPNYISPLYNSAIEGANIVEFEGVGSKIVSIDGRVWGEFSPTN